jgi:parallel beta-helix repeat protein
MDAPVLTPGNVNISVGYTAPNSNGAAIITYSIQRATVSAMTTGLTTVTSLVNPYPSTGLVNGTPYFYRVAASNAAGLGTYSAVASATPATVPAIVVISSTAAGNQTVSLAWAAPLSNGAAITGYDLMYSLSSNVATFTSLSSGLLTSPFVARGLTNGSLYFFRMAASNVMGYGPYSLTASNTPRTVPSPITDLSANPSTIATSLILSWVAPYNGGSAITGYRWFRSSNADMTGVLTSNATLVTTLSTTVTPLVAGVMSYFQIVASNVAGFSTSSGITSNFPRAVPGQVGTVTASSLNQSISLSWPTTTASNGSAISSYRSQYSLSSAAGGEWFDISIAPATTIVATGLSNGTSYYFRVSASNVAGYGLASAVVTRIPYTVPDKVGTVVVTPLNASVSLSWPTTTASNGTAITSYYYYWSVSGGAWTGVSNASNASSAVKTLLTNGSTYNFYVAASNAAGFGLSSDIVSTIPRTVPGAPTSVAAAVQTFESVRVTFGAPTSNGGNAITSYIVTPLLDGTTAQTPVTTSVSSVIVSNLIPGRGYTYRVVASNDAGLGTAATSASVITYYNFPVENPNGNTYTYYASNQPWSSKVIYNLNYADVEVSQVARSVWTISYNGLVDTLNYVRNIALTDRNVWIMDISYGTNLANNYESIKGNLSNSDVLRVGSGAYTPATQPTVSKSITLEGPPDRSAFFGVAPGVSTWCLTIEADNVTVRNLTLTTSYATTTFTKGDFILMAVGAYASGYYKSIQNTTIEDTTFVNPYTVTSSASELQYWRNRRGIALNSVSGLTIRNCTFPKTWNNGLTLASCRNVTLTGNTFYACPWSSISVLKTGQAMSNLSDYESSNINLVDNTYLDFGDTSITSLIANPSIGAGSNVATYITPLQAPILTFQPTLSYAITYSSNAGSTAQIPADFRYSFVASPLLAYVARDPLDLPPSFWAGGAGNVTVTDMSNNVRIFPVGYRSAADLLPTLMSVGDYVRGSVTVNVSDVMLDVTYAFSLDGSLAGSNASGAFTFTGLSEGAHTVSVTGTDGYVTSDAVNLAFVSDTISPTFGGITLVSGPTISGQIVVTFDASDVNGPITYATFLNDVSYSDSTTSPDTIQIPEYGTFQVNIKATDAAGNVGTSSSLSVGYWPPANDLTDITLEPEQVEQNITVKGTTFAAPIVEVLEVQTGDVNLSTGSIVVIRGDGGSAKAAVYTPDVPADIETAVTEAVASGLDTILVKLADSEGDITVHEATYTEQNTFETTADDVTVYADTSTIIGWLSSPPSVDANGDVQLYYRVAARDPNDNAKRVVVTEGFNVPLWVERPGTQGTSVRVVHRSEATSPLEPLGTAYRVTSAAYVTPIVYAAAGEEDSSLFYFEVTLNEQLGFMGAAAPDPPTGVSAVAGARRATVSWTTYTSPNPADGGSDITGYTVYWYTGATLVSSSFAATSPAIISGLDNGVAYTFKVTASNNAGGNPTESALSSASSPVTPSSGGAAVGDPYVSTLDGKIYKLPSFNGHIRLYQGYAAGHLLTVNATTRIDDDKAAMDADTAGMNGRLASPVKQDLRMSEAMSFFERLYIAYAGETMIVNIYNGFKVEQGVSWPVEVVGNVKKFLKAFSFYGDLSGYVLEILPCSDVIVRVGIVPIRHIRNSIEIIAPNMAEGNGVFVNRMTRKEMTLRKLSDLAPVEKKDAAIKRTICETFVCDAKTTSVNIPYVG